MRIVITPGHFAKLASGEILTYWVAGHLLEIKLVRELVHELSPPDPPEAREFLPLRRRGKSK